MIATIETARHGPAAMLPNTYRSPTFGRDRAQAAADALARRLGPNWKPMVWENWGWHYGAHLGSREGTHAVMVPSTNPDGTVAGWTCRMSNAPGQFEGEHPTDPRAAFHDALRQAREHRDLLIRSIDYFTHA